MPHRREQIMDAVKTAVTGLATTGANVFRGRAYPLDDADLPGLLVYQGEEEILVEQADETLICGLAVAVVPMVTATADADETLNLIASEVTVALAANFTLALPSFVQFIKEVGADEPENAGEGDQQAAAQRLRWRVQYQRSRTNPN